MKTKFSEDNDDDNDGTPDSHDTDDDGDGVPGKKKDSYRVSKTIFKRLKKAATLKSMQLRS